MKISSKSDNVLNCTNKWGKTHYQIAIKKIRGEIYYLKKSKRCTKKTSSGIKSKNQLKQNEVIQLGR